MRNSLRRLITPVVAVVTAVAVVSCSDSTVSARSPIGQPVSVSMTPAFSKSVTEAAKLYRAAGFDYNNVRVVIVRPPSDTLKDTTVTFAPGQAEVTLELSIRAEPNEPLQGGLEYRAGTVVIYRGTQTVTAHAVLPPGSTTPTEITVTAIDPALVPVRVAVSASGTGPFPTSGSVSFTAKAFNVSNGEIAGATFQWTIDDGSVASISGSGVVTPTTKGGTVRVRATASTGVFGEATATFVAPASVARVVAVSGGGQTATVGSSVAQPLVVEVQTATGTPVAGQTVTFSSSSTGTVTPSSGVTDAQGRVQTTMRVGNTAGTYTFTASCAGFTTQATVTATAGAASAMVIVSGSGQTGTAGAALANPLVVQVNDAFGNPKSGAVVSWVRGSGTGSVGSASSTTGADGRASTTYTSGTTPGSESVTASSSGAGSVTFSVTTQAGPPIKLTVVGSTTITGVVNVPISNPPFVLVTDAANNPVANVSVTATLFIGPLPVQSLSLTSDATGKVTVPATLLQVIIAGTYTIVVEKAGFTGSPITFTVTISP